jgi:hypothetical protein
MKRECIPCVVTVLLLVPLSIVGSLWLCGMFVGLLRGAM